MRRPSERWYVLTPLVAAILALQGCGGGGGGDAPTASAGGGGTTGTNQGTYQLTGTVPGTLIEAFCEDGRYFSVTSVNNGSSKHPFSMALPVGVKCQVVMTMNELDTARKTITPVAFDDGSGNAKPGITATRAGERVDTGFVDLPRDRTDSRFVDSDGDGVNDRPLDVRLPSVKPTIQLAARNLPTDPDGDGIPNRYDPDDDGDGIPDYRDTYDDVRGIDFRQKPDSDGDGIPDVEDRDRNDDGYDDNDRTTVFQPAPPTSGTVTLPASFSPDATGGQLLSSMCAQCHGTFGCSQSRFPSLLNEPGETASEFQGYIARAASLNKLNPGTQVSIMTAQAHGYTNAQALAIGNYYLQLARQQTGLQCGWGEGYEGNEGNEGNENGEGGEFGEQGE